MLINQLLPLFPFYETSGFENFNKTKKRFRKANWTPSCAWPVRKIFTVPLFCCTHLFLRFTFSCSHCKMFRKYRKHIFFHEPCYFFPIWQPLTLSYLLPDSNWLTVQLSEIILEDILWDFSFQNGDYLCVFPTEFWSLDIIS